MDHWLSCCFVVDLGAHTPISLVVRSTRVVFQHVVDLSDCSDLLDCVIIRVLPSDFSNMVWVLVSGTPNSWKMYRTR